MHPRSIHVCCDAGCAQLLRTERPRAALLPLGALRVAVFIARDALSVWCALLPFGVAYPRLVCHALRLVCAAVCLVWPALHLVWLTGARPGAFLGFCSCEPHPIKTEAHQTGVGTPNANSGTPNGGASTPNAGRAHQTRGRTCQRRCWRGPHQDRLPGKGCLPGAIPRTGLACRGRPRIRPAYAKRLPLSHAWPHFSPRA